MNENEDTATTLFQTATDMIKKDEFASVDTFLIDGGTALLSATKNVRSSTNVDINAVGIPRRRCFSHNTRMGMTRGLINAMAYGLPKGSANGAVSANGAAIPTKNQMVFVEGAEARTVRSCIIRIGRRRWRRW